MYRKIDNIIYMICGFYFLIPIFLLLLFWFKPYVSIPSIIFICYIFYKFYKSKNYLNDNDYKNIFNIRKWIILILLIIIFVFLSGAGGYFYQNWDYHARNAVLNDLIKYDWPVKYNYNVVDANIMGFNHGILSYYFTYWLPSAMIGKLFGYNAANITLFIYQMFGLLLFFYFLVRYFRKINIRYFFIFFAFSGADIIGRVIIGLINGDYINMGNFLGNTHIDTFGQYFCFSSFVTQVFWVFNQAIPAFIITLLLLNECNFKNIGIYMLLLLPFSPLPSVGLLYLILIFILFGFECKEGLSLSRIRQVFSIQNVLCFVVALPIIVLFFANAGGHQSGFIFFKDGINITDVLLKYITLLILEVYIYVLLVINKSNCRFLMLTCLFLSIIPLIFIGKGLDFVNRAGIPLQIVLLVFVIKYLNDNKNYTSDKRLFKTSFLVLFLLISSITGANEVNRSIDYTYNNYKNGISNVTDEWHTYGKVDISGNGGYINNFVSPIKNNFYFKYVIR